MIIYIQSINPNHKLNLQSQNIIIFNIDTKKFNL